MLLTFSSSGVPMSSNTLRNTSDAPATYPGMASGNTMRRNRRMPLAPRFCADSSIERSMLLSAAERLMRMNGK